VDADYEQEAFEKRRMLRKTMSTTRKRRMATTTTTMMKIKNEDIKRGDVISGG